MSEAYISKTLLTIHILPNMRHLLPTDGFAKRKTGYKFPIRFSV